jgi:hypothetical protein
VEIFVPSWIINTSGIFVDSEVELGIMLDHCLVEIGKQDMVVIVKRGLWYHEKAVIFAGMTPVDGFAGVCPGTVRTDHFPAGRVFQVNQLFLIKFDIAHNTLKFYFSTI